MNPKLTLSTLLLLFCATLSSGQFLYQRKLGKIKEEGWHQIILPSDLLSKLKSDFRDLRIYPDNSSDSLEIPYLIKISEDETETIQASIIPFNTSRKNKDLFFTITNPTQDGINMAELIFENENYQALVKIEGSNDQQNWFEIADSLKIISIQQGPLQYDYNQVDFPVSQYTYLRFQIKSEKSLILSDVTFSSRHIKKGSYNFKSVSYSREEKSKESILTSQKNQSELISKIVLAAEAGQMFYRTLRVEYLTDSAKTESGWQYYFQPIHTSIFNSFHQDTIEFEPHFISQLRVVIENNDNPPVKIKSVSTFSPEVHVISYLKSGDYKLRYGSTSVSLPNYDLAHFEKEVATSLKETFLQEEEKLELNSVQETIPWFQNKTWLWFILMAIVAVLGYFTVQMMRKV